jgi:predicted O-methyltransferase YrrM
MEKNVADRREPEQMDEDYSAWFAGKALSTDWTSRYFPTWAFLLAPRRDEPLAVLEIGSWEGRSAIFFLRYLKNCTMTCIDTFAGSSEHFAVPRWKDALPYIEARFDSNLAEFGARVEKLKGKSTELLAQLVAHGRQFDVVYIDASHHSADVQSDASFTWPMVRERGIVIFDDYEWSLSEQEIERPKLGIDTFLRVREGTYRERHRGYQLIVEKTS